MTCSNPFTGLTVKNFTVENGEVVAIVENYPGCYTVLISQKETFKVIKT